MRNLLTLKDYSGEEIANIINKAIEIKNNQSKYSDILKNKTLAMLFEKTSTRTRTSFEAGMTQLGGHAIFLDWKSSNLSVGAELKDEVKSIERYVEIIAARVKKHVTLKEMTTYAEVPIINMLCEKYHPCQSLGDMMTIKEHLGDWKGKKLVYTGIANNVSNSLVVASTKLGMKVTLAIPEKDKDAVDPELEKAAKATGLYEETTDLKIALKDADILYTDAWVNIEFMNDPKFKEEKERRLKAFMPYQVNAALLKDSKAKIMHCLPAHIGYEITRDALDHENSIAYDQAENRLHAQKSLILFLLGLLD